MDHHLHQELRRLTHADHYDPHHLLGLQPHFDGKKVIRIWRPGACEVYLEVAGAVVQASKIEDTDVFEYVVPPQITHLDYRIYHQNGLLAHDPYAFWPTVGELDQYLFSKGVHYELDTMLGARIMEHQGCRGTAFTVWAPLARRVSIVADFNYWDGRVNPLRSMGASGIWEIFIPGVGEGERYKFEVKTQSGDIKIKSDPMARWSEMRPLTASVVYNVDRYHWRDNEWMDRRIKEKDHAKPMSIYELHLGSWKQDFGRFLNYRTLAHQLAEYCHYMGFTHVELMPVQEHPFDESWGYQVTGYYAVTSRYGTPEDFQYFVDHLHLQNIGIIIDWVPAHFPTDDFSLAKFDGSCLYEHLDPRQGFHPHWNTYIFNYGRVEVANFLIGSALYWMSKMHIDGLRVDAVASMLYLDYGRESGDWIPNQYGGKENLEAIEFLKHLNSVVHQRHPGALMIAEESTAFTGVTHPLEGGGLGFDLKWNMGWMNDTLSYFSKDPIFRRYHHNELTFGLLYAFTERFALVLSHDEVVHGKCSLVNKMPGDLWQKFANLRLLYSYMICQPGKKLLFMSGELGQWDEWYCKHQIQWHLLDYPAHRGIHNMVRDINHFYRQHPALWERDSDHTGFDWIDFNDVSNSIISYRRKSSRGELICVHNFTPTFHPEYVIRCGHLNSIREVFNSDAKDYGGSGKVNPHPELIRGDHGEVRGFKVSISPLSTMIFEPSY